MKLFWTVLLIFMAIAAQVIVLDVFWDILLFTSHSIGYANVEQFEKSSKLIFREMQLFFALLSYAVSAIFCIILRKIRE